MARLSARGSIGCFRRLFTIRTKPLALLNAFSSQCGIPNVVLISDACRSTSASLGIQALTGYNIFPVVNNRRVLTYLDSFFAVRQGAPAYEVKDTTGKYDGIYTECFLDDSNSRPLTWFRSHLQRPPD